MESRKSDGNERERETEAAACISSSSGDPALRSLTESVASAPSRERRRFTGFDRERSTYQRLKPGLLANAEGKYVAIVGEDFVGPVDSHDQAEKAGYARFGLGPLYIKHVRVEDPVVEVNRLFST